jgi:hypothetical protein
MRKKNIITILYIIGLCFYNKNTVCLGQDLTLKQNSINLETFHL